MITIFFINSVFVEVLKYCLEISTADELFFVTTTEPDL